MSKYYDGVKLLSLLDIEGNRPEIYMVTSNRSAGKTVYFSRLLINKFIKRNEKFMIIYRFNYELDDVGDKFFKDVGGLFFQQYEMLAEKRARGIYAELFLFDKESEKKISCGYAVALNNADSIKKMGHLFSDTMSMFMDEFQSETNHYCNNEVDKLISIHTTVARGGGAQSRYLPIYMCSNTVTILNPYFVALGVSDRLQKDTKFLRGVGWVLEQGYNDAAADAQTQSTFMRAFTGQYTAYAAQAIYLNDNTAFIEKPSGRGHYIGTIRVDGVDYGLRQYAGEGIIYCDNSPDLTHPLRIAVTLDDHTVNYVMLKENETFIASMKWFFNHGAFRFKNYNAKAAVLKMLSY